MFCDYVKVLYFFADIQLHSCIFFFCEKVLWEMQKYFYPFAFTLYGKNLYKQKFSLYRKDFYNDSAWGSNLFHIWNNFFVS